MGTGLGSLISGNAMDDVLIDFFLGGLLGAFGKLVALWKNIVILSQIEGCVFDIDAQMCLTVIRNNTD